jgi:hypothetical protein
MGERTAAVALGVFTFGMMLVFINGLVTALDETHPGVAPLTALRELIQGPAA